MGDRRVGLRVRGAFGYGCVAAMGLALAASFMPGLPGWRDWAVAQSMALPGKFGVGETGSASYEIPITAPPGTAGMAPSLSLSYNSQAGNGLLGMGWMLEGLPSMGRCARTMVQDGVRGGVNFDANDRFCLDGQRLIAISGAYGADGTEYRTEIESFSKVVSRGTAGTGPAWFEVRTKTGQIMEFGNSTDSRILAQGKVEARSWAVNKVSDTKGNFYTISYVNDAPTGEAYPSRLDYTGNAAAGLSPYNSVRFFYTAARPDSSTGYHAGAMVKSTVRMSNVQTFAGSAMVADYRLAYQQGTVTGRSQLASVTLCDGGGSCLPATRFTWQNGTTNYTVVNNVGGQDGTLSNYRPYIADFNGDGLADVFWDSGSSGSETASSGNHTLWTNTGNGNFQVTTNWLGQDGTTVSSGVGNVCRDNYSLFLPLIADFNRDGRSDIWWRRARCSNGAVNSPLMQWSSTSGGHSVSTGANLPIFHWKDGIYRIFALKLAEINGDGRTDIVWYDTNVIAQPMWLTQQDGTVLSGSLDIPTGQILSGSFTWTGIANFSWKQKGDHADFNGDGLGDLHFGYDNGFGFTALWLGLGNGSFQQLAGSGDTAVFNKVPYFSDFNADGQTDILWDHESDNNLDYRSQGLRVAWLSKGDGTFAKTTNVGGLDNALTDGYRPYVSDFNGDGRSDVFWNKEQERSSRSTGSRTVWLNTGDNQFNAISNFSGQDGTLVDYVPLLADFNGDGKTDILWDKREGEDTRSKGNRVFWLSDGIISDLMTRATNGVGATATVTYKSITDAAIYTKDNGAVDPLIDLQGAMQVVSRIDQSNGIGGQVSLAYAYTGAKAHQDGRGYLGFRQVKVTDPQTGIVQTTTYRQDYPFIGMVASETKTLNSRTLSTSSNTYNATDLGTGRKQVFLAQSQAASNDLNGTALPSVVSSYQYDAYGNATQITVTSSDGYSKTTTNTYNNDTGNWLLGRLATATVTSIAPAVSQQAPTEDTTPDPFDFVDVNAFLSTSYEASAVISGVNRTLTAAVSGGDAQIRKNGAGNWSNSVAASPGDTLNIRMTSSNSYSTSVTAVLTLGSATVDWAITTASAPCTAGSANYSTAGTFTFAVPASFNSLTVKAWGAGGAGGGGGGVEGNGGVGAWGSTGCAGGGVATGGSGGGGGGGASAGTGACHTAFGVYFKARGGNGGNGGSPSNIGGVGGIGSVPSDIPDGDIAMLPVAGPATSSGVGANGSTAPAVGGGVGGTGTTGIGANGNAPGGGGAGGGSSGSKGGSGGASGGYGEKSFTPQTLTPGSSVAVHIGFGGRGGRGSGTAGKNAGDGGAGGMNISWTCH